MKFAEIKPAWKALGTLGYQRRLSAYLTRMDSGIDRGDEHAAIEYVSNLFSDLEANPLDQAALANDRAAARKLEDGE